MGFLSDVVDNAVNAAKNNGNDVTKTDLQTFLNKFSSSAGRYIDTIDPLATFDVQFKFYPTLSLDELKNQKKPSTFSRVMSSVGNSITSGLKNAADNATGGLFSYFTDGDKSKSILKQRDAFDNIHTHTFMEYLAKANLLQVGEQWQDDMVAPLILNLGPYVQNITVPNLKIQTGKVSNSNMGDFPIVTAPGVYPDGQMTMTIINTKASLHERIFYPWLKEISLPYWSYDTQPYTTATITVDFTKHNDVQYVFCGCRPEQVYTLQAKQAAGDSSNITRDVSFVYDAMFIISSLKKVDKAKDKILGLAGNVLGGAGKMLNI